MNVSLSTQRGPVGRRRSGPRSKSSPYIGVTQYKRTGRYEAHIWIVEQRGAKGHQRHLGSYATAEDAARCYDRAALRLRGLSAQLNFSVEEYAQDTFILAYGHLEAFRYLDLLRAEFALRSERSRGGAGARGRAAAGAPPGHSSPGAARLAGAESARASLAPAHREGSVSYASDGPSQVHLASLGGSGSTDSFGIEAARFVPQPHGHYSGEQNGQQSGYVTGSRDDLARQTTWDPRDDHARHPHPACTGAQTFPLPWGEVSQRGNIGRVPPHPHHGRSSGGDGWPLHAREHSTPQGDHQIAPHAGLGVALSPHHLPGAYTPSSEASWSQQPPSPLNVASRARVSPGRRGFGGPTQAFGAQTFGARPAAFDDGFSSAQGAFGGPFAQAFGARVAQGAKGPSYCSAGAFSGAINDQVTGRYLTPRGAQATAGAPHVTPCEIDSPCDTRGVFCGTGAGAGGAYSPADGMGVATPEAYEAARRAIVASSSEESLLLEGFPVDGWALARVAFPTSGNGDETLGDGTDEIGTVTAAVAVPPAAVPSTADRRATSLTLPREHTDDEGGVQHGASGTLATLVSAPSTPPTSVTIGVPQRHAELAADPRARTRQHRMMEGETAPLLQIERQRCSRGEIQVRTRMAHEASAVPQHGLEGPWTGITGATLAAAQCSGIDRHAQAGAHSGSTTIDDETLGFGFVDGAIIEPWHYLVGDGPVAAGAHQGAHVTGGSPGPNPAGSTPIHPVAGSWVIS